MKTNIEKEIRKVRKRLKQHTTPIEEKNYLREKLSQLKYEQKVNYTLIHNI